MVELLLDSGADLSIRSQGEEEGWSPLVWAYAMDHTDIFKMLGMSFISKNILTFNKIRLSFLDREQK